MNGDLLRWAVIAFVSGSLPFSVWIGRWALGADIRRHGDRNPGASNVLRAGGRWTALLAVLLDGFKGAIPVSLAYLWMGFGGWQLVLLAVLPVAGHAFSPFLGFNGGKAVAVTFGIWTGLTAWEGPLVLGIFLGLASYLFGANGWAVVMAMSGLLGYIWLSPGGWNGALVRPDASTLTWIWLGNMAILIWKHRHDLTQTPTLTQRKSKPS